MTPDWNQAPPGATHFNVHNGCWYRRKFYAMQVWRDGSWKYTPSGNVRLDDERYFVEVPR
jgi:hypothetical protein